MTLKSTGPSDFDRVAALGNMTPEPETSPAETPPAEPATPTPEPEAAPATEPTSEPAPAPENPTKDELDILRRVIARDPNLREAYVNERYGLPPSSPYQPAPVAQPVQPPVQPPPVPQSQAPQLPFDESTYDPTDMQHQIALNNYLLGQQLQPFLQFINETKQEQQQFQAQTQQAEQGQRLTKMEDDIRGMMDKQIPGFSTIYSAPTPSPEQEALANLAYAKFTEKMHQDFPPTQRGADGSLFNPHWWNSQVHQQVISQIAPTVKALAEKLGIAAPASSTPKPQGMARATFSEDSNAVPASSPVNPFSKALKKGDHLGMVAALSKMKD